MANKDIPGLTQADALTGGELVHVVQGGNSRRVTTGAIAALAGGTQPPASGTHSFWRLNITSTEAGANISIAEIEFLASTDGADQAVGGSPTVSSGRNGSLAAAAFDDDPSTYWNGGNEGGVDWIAYQFADPVLVAAINLQARSPDAATDAPKDFTVEFSDDGVTWEVAWTVTGQTGWIAGQVRQFVDPSTEANVYVVEAPKDGSLYARKDGAWEAFTPGGGGGGGAVEVIASANPIAGVFDFSDLDLGLYSEVEIVMEGLTFTEVGLPIVTFDVDGTEVTDGYHVAFASRAATGSTEAEAYENGAGVALLDETSTNWQNDPANTDASYSGALSLFSATGVSHKNFVFSGSSGAGTSGTSTTSSGGGTLRNTGNITGVRLHASGTATINAGRVTLYGKLRTPNAGGGGSNTGAAITVSPETGDYSLALADAGAYKLIDTSAAIATVTVPDEATVAFPVGTRIYVEQDGTNVVTIAPAAGVTVHSRGGVFSIAGDHGVAVLFKKGADLWTLTGDLA